jgi:hypothetical protein
MSSIVHMYIHAYSRALVFALSLPLSLSLFFLSSSLFVGFLFVFVFFFRVLGRGRAGTMYFGMGARCVPVCVCVCACARPTGSVSERHEKRGYSVPKTKGVADNQKSIASIASLLLPGASRWRHHRAGNLQQHHWQARPRASRPSRDKRFFSRSAMGV